MRLPSLLALSWLLSCGCRSQVEPPAAADAGGAADAAAADAARAAVVDASVVDASPDLAAERLPWDVDLRLVVRGLADHEGRSARLRIHYTVEPVKTPWRSTVVAGGRVEMFWPGGFDSGTFGEFVELFIDRDGDGACSEGSDPAWQLFINNTFMNGVNTTDLDLKDEGPSKVWTVRRCADLG